MPWRSGDSAAVLRRKDKQCTFICKAYVRPLVNEKKPVAEMKSRRGAYCWVSEDSARVLADL